MAYNNGGRATFVDKGVYSPNVTYQRLDYVKYNGSIFVCKKTSLGNTPSNTGDTEFWTTFINAASVGMMYLYDDGGTVATQRPAIQFMNGSLVDDNTNNRTKVTVGITNTEWSQIQTILGTS